MFTSWSVLVFFTTLAVLFFFFTVALVIALLLYFAFYKDHVPAGVQDLMHELLATRVMQSASFACLASAGLVYFSAWTSC